LSFEAQPTADVKFGRGAGHLDWCKEVVGPAHMYRLCKVVKDVAYCGIDQHFLIGNNVAFEDPNVVVGDCAVDASAETHEAGVAALLDIMKACMGSKPGTWPSTASLTVSVLYLLKMTLLSRCGSKKIPLGGRRCHCPNAVEDSGFEID
jgi:hypothetical protein